MKTFNFYTSSADDQIFYILQPKTTFSLAHWFKLKAGWNSVQACRRPNLDQLELVREIQARNITEARKRFHQLNKADRKREGSDIEVMDSISHKKISRSTFWR